MSSVKSIETGGCTALDDLDEITKVCDQLLAEQKSKKHKLDSDHLTHKEKSEKCTKRENVTRENSSSHSQSPPQEFPVSPPSPRTPPSEHISSLPTSPSHSHHPPTETVPLTTVSSPQPFDSSAAQTNKSSPPHSSAQENTCSHPGFEPADKKLTQPVETCDLIQSSQGEEEPQFDSSVDMKTWLNSSVRVLIEHLNRYGVCVVDNFLGEEKGSKLLDEIWRMQKREYFVDGQVMSGGGQIEPTIRSDKITWTDGFAPLNCPYLRYCVRLLDSIVLRANRIKNNGELGKYRLTGRTSIMCACYPGGGSRYVKHVDNPNKDGRVVTAIYYLNKHWDSRVDGGSLKIYSQVNKGKVIQIDPVFDRVVFFWSDARNPHEVLPANKPRFAVTVWYLDEKEKQEHQRRTRAEYQHPQAIRRGSNCDNLNQLKGCQR